MREKNPNPCKQCKVRKSKCDGAIPQCSACARARKNLGVCSYQESLEALPMEDLSNSLSGSQGLYPLAKQSFTVLNSLNTLQSYTSSTSSVAFPSQNTLNLSVKLESFLEAHLLRLSSTSLLNRDSCFNILFPTKRFYVVSDELKDALCCYGLFLSSHPEIFSGDISVQARLDLAQRYYGIEPLLLLVSTNNFISMYHVYDSIRALVIRAFIALDTLHHVQSFNDLIKSAFVLVRNYDILNQQYFTMSQHHFSEQTLMALEERVERLSILALLLNLDTTFMFEGRFQFEDWEIPLPDLPVTQALHYSLSPADMEYSVWIDSKLQQILINIALELPEEGLDPVNACLKEIKEMTVYRQSVEFMLKSMADPKCFTYEEQRILHEEVIILSRPLPFHSLTQFIYESKIEEPVFSKITKRSIHQVVSVLVMLSSIHFPSFASENKFALEFGGKSLFTSRQIIFLTVKCLASLMTTIQIPKQSLISPLLADISFSFAKVMKICKVAIDCFKSDIKTREFALVWFMVSQDIQNSLEVGASIWPGLTYAKVEISSMLQQFA